MSTVSRSSTAQPALAGAAESRGLIFGFLGITVFSLSLPATRLAVSGLDPFFVGLGRSLAVSPLAGFLLLVSSARWPSWKSMPSFLLVISGVIVGFPTLSALAMQSLPASHGAVVLGILPLATALAGALRAGDRPSIGFWLAGIAGSVLVVAFALLQGAGQPRPADGLLLLAVIAAALGYAEGGRLAQRCSGWQVICWALVIAAPLLVVPVTWLALHHNLDVAPKAWAGFAYVALFSQFIGFFFWYKGLALGGVARVNQVQLAQLFLTLIASALFLGESVDIATILFGVAVAVVLAIGRKMPVQRRSITGKP